VGHARGLGTALAVGDRIAAHAWRERHGGHSRRGEAAERDMDGGQRRNVGAMPRKTERGGAREQRGEGGARERELVWR